MKAIRAINNYFFDSETINFSDFFFFFGIMIIMIIVAVTSISIS